MTVFFGRLLQRRRNQTILDQLIVSGSNFVTSIILVRGLGLEQFGIFTVAYTCILLANSVQMSFISAPMITLAALCEDKPAKTNYLRGMYGVQLLFCLLVTVLAAVVSECFSVIQSQVVAARVVIAFICAIAAFLMQDWLRRYYFAAGKSHHTVWNDAISYVGQVGILLALISIHRLTVDTALWSIAITSMSAFLLGMKAENLQSTYVEARSSWHRSRNLSRDLAIANQLQWFVYQGAMLIGASVLGAEAAGSIRATQNVVGPINVGYQAMENLVPLRAGEEMRRGGTQQVASFLLRVGTGGFVVLSVVFLFIAAFSRPFLTFFYGHDVALYTGILDLQMLYFLLLWPLRQFTYLFRTINRTSPILMASMVAAFTSLLAIYPCMRGFHATGIMIAAVAGQGANLLYLAIAWLRIRATSTNKNGNDAVLAEL